MISFAGVDLIVPTPAIVEEVTSSLDPGEIRDFLYPAGLPNLMKDAPWRGEFEPPKPRLNILHWPAGAMRFAVGHFLIDEPDLAIVRAVTMNAGTPRPALLEIADGRHRISAPMNLLAVRHLAKVDALTPGLHLLTLVDDRYRWWYLSVAWAFSPYVTTYDQLYAQASTAIGFPIVADTVDPKYLGPPVDLMVDYSPFPMMLDAIALSAGQRIVRTLSGTIYALNAAGSLATMRLNASILTEDLPQNNERLAGFPMSLSPLAGTP